LKKDKERGKKEERKKDITSLKKERYNKLKERKKKD
jgi:hypothetical protein